MDQPSGTLQCPRCGERKQEREFFSAEQRRRRRDYICRACHRTRQVASYKPWRDYVTAIKLRLGCVDCGYRRHAEALDFDHLPGTVKVANISRLTRHMVPFAEIDAEIAKCEVVCANCHRIRTASRTSIESSTAYWDLREAGCAASVELDCEPDQRPFEAA